MVERKDTRLAARILGRGSSWRECDCVAQAEQDRLQRHVEIEVPRGALLGQLNLTEQVQQRIGVGLFRVGLQRREIVKVEYLVPISSDLKQDEVADPSSQPGKGFLRTVGFRNRFG